MKFRSESAGGSRSLTWRIGKDKCDVVTVGGRAWAGNVAIPERFLATRAMVRVVNFALMFKCL